MNNSLTPEQALLHTIHRAYHGMMNGTVAQSMQDKGIKYKFNFGVEIPRLQEYAEELPHTHEMAQTLWNEDFRESRLIAPMLMPTERFFPEIADIWIESMHYTEEANACVHYLFSRLPYASQKAFEWIAREELMFQYCGFQLLGSLFGKGMLPAPRDIDEYLDQAAAALASDNYTLRSAAHKSLLKFMDINEETAAQADRTLEAAGL